MMYIENDFLLWFINLLIENLKVVVLIMKLTKMSNYLKNYINQLLRHFDSSKKIMIKILNKSKDVFVTKKKK